MKRIILITAFSLLVLVTRAQLSRIDTLNYPNPYNAKTTLVRNYNENYNIIMSYGPRPNLILPLDTVKDQSFFYIENINTGVIIYLFSLPGGYKVNDIRFVTLRREENGGTTDFCCFCGTQTRIVDGYWTAVIDDEPSYYVLVPQTYGFVGFFSMDDAINPTGSCTAKVRNIEKTSELWRMTCYAEDSGYYHPYQTAFRDNVVADVIGVPDTTAAPSCFCRVKFYPDYNGASLWVNNIRFNKYSQEIMRDIVGTESYVVTASENSGFDDTIRLRYNDKETELHVGGLELSDTYFPVELSSTFLWGGTISTNTFIHPFKLCSLPNESFSLAFQGRYVTGLYTYRYSLATGISLINGTYEKGDHILRDLVYMPQSEMIAALMDGDIYPQMTSMTPYSVTISDNLPITVLYNKSCTLQSLYPYINNAWEYLLWSGIHSTVPANTHLARQRMLNEYDNTSTCFDPGGDVSSDTTISNGTSNASFRIFKRFSDDQVKYPVRLIVFTPMEVEKIPLCKKME